MLTRNHQAARQQAGDTLIEVLFAVAVFSLVVVGALSIMNQGTATAQRSLEITLARQQMDAQADTLRFLQSSYVQAYYSGITYDTGDTLSSPAEEYYKVIQRISGTASASSFGSLSCGTKPSGAFILNPRTATLNPDTNFLKKPDVYPTITYNAAGAIESQGSQGLWVEGVRSSVTSGENASYIDFHIRACWDGPGQGSPMNLGTIVRLYEPRG
ncbi:MAG: prepilin-type N-terminal cleavage/methylation domain-containing protein [Candidatus Microsaccharimonas sp.]